MIGNALKELFEAIRLRIRYSFGRGSVDSLPQKVAENISNSQNLMDRLSEIGESSDLVRIELDPALLESVQWQTYKQDIPPPELAADPLYLEWCKFPGGMKWSHYFRVYRELFDSRRDQPMKILEIGVFKGASLKVWKSYFRHPESTVVGIDIDPNCAKFDAPAERIHVRIGSQTDFEFLRQVVAEFGPFDVIIDDGSHVSGHILTSFNFLFLRGLKDPGLYFVEDLHAMYWPSYRDTYSDLFDMCREMVHQMHAHYRQVAFGDIFVSRPSEQRKDVYNVPRLATLVREIRIFDSMVAIERAHMPFAPHLVMN